MSDGLDPKLVTVLAPRSPAAEAFRVLRTNLQFMGLDRPLASLVITSAGPEEGKTLTAANLAVAFAQSGQRVVLVDADLRRPMVHRTFGLSHGLWRGLTSVLTSAADLGSVLAQTPVEGLRVLPSGPIPPNPAEMLGSQRMRHLMAALLEQFDLVVYDTPPVLAVADAPILAAVSDGTLLVVRANKVSHPLARRAHEALSAVKARVLGVVLDGVPGRARSGYYDYHYYGARKR